MEALQAHRELSPYLFTEEHGQLIHPDTFTKRLRKIYESIGFPKEYHLHTLRHYYVTSLLHSGVDKQTVADLVGHADTGFLERTYCHPQQEQKVQAAGAHAFYAPAKGRGPVQPGRRVSRQIPQRLIVAFVENRFRRKFQ